MSRIPTQTVQKPLSDGQVKIDGEAACILDPDTNDAIGPMVPVEKLSALKGIETPMDQGRRQVEESKTQLQQDDDLTKVGNTKSQSAATQIEPPVSQNGLNAADSCRVSSAGPSPCAITSSVISPACKAHQAALVGSSKRKLCRIMAPGSRTPNSRTSNSDGSCNKKRTVPWLVPGHRSVSVYSSSVKIAAVELQPVAETGKETPHEIVASVLAVWRAEDSNAGAGAGADARTDYLNPDRSISMNTHDALWSLLRRIDTREHAGSYGVDVFTKRRQLVRKHDAVRNGCRGPVSFGLGREPRERELRSVNADV